MSKKPVHIDIKEIKDPSFVKTLDKRGVGVLCDALRAEIIKAASLYGGHLSSNLGAVELTVSLHRSFSPPKDLFVFDVGHLTYAHKILTGRSLEELGSEGASARFAEREKSPFDPMDAGHSSTSLSIAQGFAVARDLKGENYDVVAVIGDASIANGLAFEALNNIGQGGHKIIIVLNDNDMSISTPHGAMRNLLRKISTARFYNRAKTRYRSALSKTESGRSFFAWTKKVKDAVKSFLLGFPNSFEALGFTYVGPVDGHNVKALDKAFRKAKNATKPVLVHVLTKKGKGYKPAEEDKTGLYHAVSPFDPKKGIDPEESGPSYPSYMGGLTHEALEKRPDAVLISAAMMQGSGLLRSFNDFPDRTYDVGIAEEHAVTFASGLALRGLHPIVSLYSTFLQRSFDEILHDLARPKGLNATLLIDRAGLPGPDGATHAGVYDPAFLKTIPGVTLEMPSSPMEARYLFERSFAPKRGIVAIRYPNEPIENVENPLSDLERAGLGDGFIALKEGDAKKALLLIGPRGRDLFEKNRSLWDGKAYIVTRLAPVPAALIARLKDTKDLRVYDPYGVRGGFLESLESALLENGLAPKIRALTLPDAYIDHGTKAEQYRRFGLDEAGFKSLLGE